MHFRTRTGRPDRPLLACVVFLALCTTFFHARFLITFPYYFLPLSSSPSSSLSWCTTAHNIQQQWNFFLRLIVVALDSLPSVTRGLGQVLRPLYLHCAAYFFFFEQMECEQNFNCSLWIATIKNCKTRLRVLLVQFEIFSHVTLKFSLVHNVLYVYVHLANLQNLL